LVLKLQERQWQGTKNLAIQPTKQKTNKHALSHLYSATQRSPKAVATLPTWLGTLESAVDDLVCAHLRVIFNDFYESDVVLLELMVGCA